MTINTIDDLIEYFEKRGDTCSEAQHFAYMEIIHLLGQLKKNIREDCNRISKFAEGFHLQSDKYRWHKVEDELPDESEEVWVYGNGKYDMAHRGRRISRKRVYWFYKYSHVIEHEITHWRYLDKPNDD